MKKVIIGLACLFGGLFTLLIVARLTKAFVVYTIPSPSNLPTLPVGSLVVASSLKTPQRGEFAVYKHEKEVWMHRCVAKAGDVLEMKNGDLYVNKKLMAEPYVYNEYLLTKPDLQSIQGYVEKSGQIVDYREDGLAIVRLTGFELKKYNLKPKRYVLEDDLSYLSPDMKSHSPDNFGPLVIPAGFIFVLGDNRHEAADSRYIGFIKEQDVVATILNKK